MKICSRCLEEKGDSEFPSAGIVNEVKYYRRVCIKCYSSQKSEKRRALSNKFDEFKRTLKCVMCGNQDHRVLEFHHSDPTTKYAAVSDLVSRNNSWTRIVEEINKCKCLCANCHRILHYKE